MKNRHLCAVLAAMVSLPIFIGSASAGEKNKDFVFSVNLHADEVQSRTFDKRLKREARAYCRDAFGRVGASGVISGCQRAIVKAVKDAFIVDGTAFDAERNTFSVKAQKQ